MGKKRPKIRDGGTKLTASQVFKVLADKHRRAILRELCELADHDDMLSVDQLVNESLWTAAGLSTGPATHRVRLVTVCCHVHLPKLAEAGVIEYWPQEGIVKPTPAIERIQPLLELAEPLEQSLHSNQ